jgi:hypothetical protein
VPDLIALTLGSSMTSWIVIVVTGAITLLLTFDTHAPGIAIGVLSIVAGILVLIQPTAAQKLLFIILMSGLFLDETRAISADTRKKDGDHRTDQTARQDRLNQILMNNNDRTQAILSSANAQFSSTIIALKKIEHSDSEIQAAAQQGIRQLIGGNSFPWAEPFSEARFKDAFFGTPKQSEKKYFFIIRNSGDYALSDVDLDIIHFQNDQPWDGRDSPSIYHVGTIGPRSSRQVDYLFWPTPQAGKSDVFILEFFYSGGAVRQYLFLTEGGQNSAMRFDESTDITVAPAPCVLDQLNNSDQKRPNYKLKFKIDSTGGGIVDADSELSLDSVKEQQRIAEVQKKCSAVRLDVSR